MKRIIPILLLLMLLLFGCSKTQSAQIVTTTLPVYEFTVLLCEGTDISVDRLITENVSCLHDYTLQVKQTKKLEAAQLVVISGAGLENFLSDILPEGKDVIIATGLPNEEVRDHKANHTHEHSHESDPHLWLSVSHAKEMCVNICEGLTRRYPQHKAVFENNMAALLKEIDDIGIYADSQLSSITSRNIITFHDGFSHMAEEYGFTIVKAIEEESGSEASAKELIEIITLVEEYEIKAIFTETNGSDSAATVIAKECNIPIYTLDMAMSGDSWFDAMYKNIDTLKEALQ